MITTLNLDLRFLVRILPMMAIVEFMFANVIPNSTTVKTKMGKIR